MSTVLGWCLDNLHDQCRRVVGELVCGCDEDGCACAGGEGE